MSECDAREAAASLRHCLLARFLNRDCSAIAASSSSARVTSHTACCPPIPRRVALAAFFVADLYCNAAAYSCRTACWFDATPANSSFAEQCFCRVDQAWLPSPSASSTPQDSARLLWPCESDLDCSFNGKCSSPTRHAEYDDESSALPSSSSSSTTGCVCDAAWQGPTCSELALEPVDRSQLGYQYTTPDDTQGGQGGQGSNNVSSWGGTILLDEKSGLYHGWASEMTEHCGINAWETNSQVSGAWAWAAGVGVWVWVWRVVCH